MITDFYKSEPDVQTSYEKRYVSEHPTVQKKKRERNFESKLLEIGSQKVHSSVGIKQLQCTRYYTEIKREIDESSLQERETKVV